jgi:hypothetical protein
MFLGVQQIQLRIESRENGDLGAVAPYSGVPLNFQTNETHILIRLLRMYIPWNWENFPQLWQNFGITGGGGGVQPPTPFGTPLYLWVFFERAAVANKKQKQF